MKWQESLTLFLGIGGLVQLIKWILDSLNIDFSTTINFFLASIFALQLISIFILINIQRDQKIMKEFLKSIGFKDEEGVINKMFKNKKAELDARVLLLFAILVILYLLYKAFISN